MKVRENVMFLIAINHAINIPSIDPFASDYQPMKIEHLRVRALLTSACS